MVVVTVQQRKQIGVMTMASSVVTELFFLFQRVASEQES